MRPLLAGMPEEGRIFDVNIGFWMIVRLFVIVLANSNIAFGIAVELFAVLRLERVGQG